MTLDKHEEIIAKLAALIPAETDDASATLILSQLQDDYSETIGLVNVLEHECVELREKNEKLRAGNMELLLSRGSKVISELKEEPIIDDVIENLPDPDKLAEQFL